MVTTEALKLLYKKLGGSADVENITAISDMVDLIEDVAGGGGGGASGLVINVHTDDGLTFTLDKNYSEISSAIENGSVPMVLIVSPNGATTLGWLYSYRGENEGGYSVFITVVDNGSLSPLNFHSNSATGVLTAIMG